MPPPPPQKNRSVLALTFSSGIFTDFPPNINFTNLTNRENKNNSQNLHNSKSSIQSNLNGN